MVATEVEEQIKPLVKSRFKRSKSATSFVSPQGALVTLWSPARLESPYKNAVDLFTGNADFISHSLDAMDDSFLL